MWGGNGNMQRWQMQKVISGAVAGEPDFMHVASTSDIMVNFTLFHNKFDILM